MILVGIVLYNPNIERLKQNIEKIKNQADELILIDNFSDNIEEIKETFRNYIIIENKENKGIAYALNQMLDYAVKNEYEWFLSLDQDSLAKEELILNYKKVIKYPKVAMITCNIIDRNYKIDTIEEEQIRETDKCITSGTLNNTKILKNIGGFDNKMFIDYVDFDICENIKRKGYKIIKVNYNGLLHEVGHGKEIKFFGKKQIIYNHSSFRIYYIIRNGIYYAKKHHLRKFYILTLKRAILILIYQSNKKENFKQIIKGIKDSNKMEKD